ncbi:hypothetical protein PPL_05934 [Heterostelium album PN500]|uniref:Ankyrin repeat protein n=1 Tax=Heterostelium pallidum (strain ATCC 26659 / Pp 5 / PN500) TaxID=670386 RepID=D3BBR5_HETP5|nr:hypothetical protein PPL_05934 [Heterostelium album PN500]EFA81098.1 hypothetical protein PPL_05934 [Heterostelium album PN500]|eukprot:XP_020433216.1 hypothetical protein PPL_05934 [Heterostelium album PN500]
MDKSKFTKVFNNNVLNRLIFQFVQFCNVQSKLHLNDKKRYGWSKLIQNPRALAGNGYFSLLKEYFQSNSIDSFRDIDVFKILRCAIQSSNQNSIHILRKSLFAVYATRSNRFDIVKYMDGLEGTKWNYDQSLDEAPKVINDSDQPGNLEMLIFLSERTKSSSSVLGNAALVGRVDMIEWLIKNRPSKDLRNSRMYMKAVTGGHINVLEYLQRENLDSPLADGFCLLDIAASNGKLDCLKWLHSNNINRCSTDAMDMAAENGDLQTVKWLHYNRTEGCTTKAMDGASKKGHLDLVMWLHYNRTEGCSTKAFDGAAKKGHIDLVRWLHENRTESCTMFASSNAVINGQLEILKWFNKNLPQMIDPDVMNLACEAGHIHIVRWMHENRTESCNPFSMDEAARFGHYEVVRFLHENRTEGCTQNAINFAATHGHLNIVQYLHFNRTEGCSVSAIDSAARNRYLNVVKWLIENRTEGFSSKAISIAEMTDYHEIVEYLTQNINRQI